MTHSGEVHIESIVGPFIARLSDDFKPDEYTMMRRNFLDMQGVEFPSQKYERAMQLGEAYAASLRGTVVLAENGTVIEPPKSIDYAEIRTIVADESHAIHNAERLKVLVRSELIAKAGALALQSFTSHQHLEQRDSVETLQKLLLQNKQFIQLIIATQEWGEPWSTIAAKEIEGPALVFPLGTDDIIETHPLLTSDPIFDDLRTDSLIGLHRWGIATHVEKSVMARTSIARSLEERGNISNASVLGLYSRHSPEAASELLLRNVSPSEDIDWVHEMTQAAERSFRHLYTNGRFHGP